MRKSLKKAVSSVFKRTRSSEDLVISNEEEVQRISENDDWVIIRAPIIWNKTYPISAQKQRSQKVWTSYGIACHYMPFLQEIEKT